MIAHRFRRLQAVQALPESGLVVEIEAKPKEREDVAAFLDVPVIHTLRARLTLQRWRGHGLVCHGQVDCDLQRFCVVTLEPLEYSLVIPVDRKFLPPSKGQAETQVAELILDPDGEDPPETLGADLDLGAITVEELGLALEPYPRKAGLEPLTGTDTEPGVDGSPFAVLKGLSTKG